MRKCTFKFLSVLFLLVCGFNVSAFAYYQVEGSTSITLPADQLDGVKTVMTDAATQRWVLGCFTAYDGQGVEALRIYNWGGLSPYCYVKFFYVKNDESGNPLYHLKMVNEEDVVYVPRGTWHDKSGCLNVTNKSELFVGGLTDKEGQDIKNGALWRVTLISGNEYEVANVGNGAKLCPANIRNGDQCKGGNVKLYSKLAEEETPGEELDLITNKGFENGGISGWTNNIGWNAQNNRECAQVGNYYAEIWKQNGISKGMKLYQTLAQLGKGWYQLRAYALRTKMNADSNPEVYVYANENKTLVDNDYSDIVNVNFYVSEPEDVEIGIKVESNYQAKWVAWDEVRLFKIGGSDFEFKAEPATLEFTRKNETKTLTITGNGMTEGDVVTIDYIPSCYELNKESFTVGADGKINETVTVKCIADESCDHLISILYSDKCKIDVNASYERFAPIKNITTGKLYDTFAEAYSATTAGDELQLFENISDNATIGKLIKLNGDGYRMGDLTISESGNLVLTGKTIFGTVVLKSAPGIGAGQIFSDGGDESTATAVYAERKIRDAESDLWYPIALPFSVDAANGIYNTLNNKISGGIWFMEYSGANRAVYGSEVEGGHKNNWSFTTSLTAGKAYMIYMNPDVPNTLRFKAGSLSDLLVSEASVDYYNYTGDAEAKDYGWNFISQPMSVNAKTDLTVASYIQICSGGSKNDSGNYYSTIEVTDETILAPYTAFMYQAEENGSFNYSRAEGDADVKSAIDRMPSYFELTLSDAKGNKDVTYVGASADAADSYEIGKDLLKAGSTNSRVQITTFDFGLELTVNDAKMKNGKAEIPLNLVCPEPGRYTLSVTSVVDGVKMLLMYKGTEVCKLTSEDYAFKTDNSTVLTDYSVLLEFEEGILTSTPNGADASVYAIDRVIYVGAETAKNVSNLAGVSVNNPVAESGVYLIKTDDEIYKLNVK
ncbi:MAG: hypothetical protein MJ010_01245 [Paludibacteraceae bacterium]|nr:hypothetical protein [Paludibacteraceae bacterium]